MHSIGGRGRIFQAISGQGELSLGARRAGGTRPAPDGRLPQLHSLSTFCSLTHPDCLRHPRRRIHHHRQHGLCGLEGRGGDRWRILRRMVDFHGLRAPLTCATTEGRRHYAPPTGGRSRPMMAPADAPVSASCAQLTARRRKSAWGPCSSRTRCPQRAILWAPGGWVASLKGRCEPPGWPLRVISGFVDTQSLSCVRCCAEAGTRRLPRATRAPRSCALACVLHIAVIGIGGPRSDIGPTVELASDLGCSGQAITTYYHVV